MVANAVWALRTAAAPGWEGRCSTPKRLWGIPARLARRSGAGEEVADVRPPIGVREVLTGTQVTQWEGSGF